MRLSIKALSWWLLAAAMVLPTHLVGDPPNGLEHRFAQDGNSYSFRGAYTVDADPDCLLDVVFRFDHIKGVGCCEKK